MINININTVEKKNYRLVRNNRELDEQNIEIEWVKDIELKNTYWGSYGQFGIENTCLVNLYDKKTHALLAEEKKITVNFEWNWLGDNDEDWTYFMNDEEKEKFEELNTEDADWDEYEKFMEEMRDKYEEDYKDWVCEMLMEEYNECGEYENFGELIAERAEENIEDIIYYALDNEYYLITNEGAEGFNEEDTVTVYNMNTEEEIYEYETENNIIYFDDNNNIFKRLDETKKEVTQEMRDNLWIETMEDYIYDYEEIA